MTATWITLSFLSGLACGVGICKVATRLEMIRIMRDW